MTQNLPQFIKKTILCTVFTIAWTGMAQTQESAANANQPSGDQAAELGKQATNPLSSSWLMPIEQNNNWVGMALKMGDRVQSNLLYQPLMNVKLTDNWTLFTRPVLTLFNSTPFVNPSRQGERTTAFGDTVLAFAVAPRPFFGGHLTVAARTESKHLLRIIDSVPSLIHTRPAGWLSRLLQPALARLSGTSARKHPGLEMDGSYLS